MFSFSNELQHIAVITDTGERFSYESLEAEGARIASHCVGRNLAFCLCRNTYASLVGYVGFLSGKVSTVLLDADKDAEMLVRLILLYSPRYVWTPSERVGDLPEGKVVYAFEEYISSNVMLLPLTKSVGLDDAAYIEVSSELYPMDEYPSLITAHRVVLKASFVEALPSTLA